MQKIVYGIIFLFYSTAYAETVHANFDVSYGIFGKIGMAKALLAKETKSYTIDIKLEATGLAKFLSFGRQEHHISKGHIHKGLMISDLYQVIKSHGDVLVNKEYYFDHKLKRVKKIYKKFKKGKLVSEKKTILDFYAKDDLLTLYFNLDTAVGDKIKPKIYTFKAVGAERQKGKVTVIIPKENNIERYKETLGEDAVWYATTIIHQQIFSSKEGRLMLGIAEDGITNKAVLQDVILFGDIRAVRMK